MLLHCNLSTSVLSHSCSIFILSQVLSEGEQVRGYTVLRWNLQEEGNKSEEIIRVQVDRNKYSNQVDTRGRETSQRICSNQLGIYKRKGSRQETSQRIT